VNIGGIEVGGANPCRFVAEVSNAHNGDFARAHRLVDAIATTGAEFIKFQSYTPDELVSLRGDGPAPDPWGAQGWSMRDLYTKAQTPLAWLPELFQHARDLGLVPFSSVFGLTSLAACEAVDCPAYKVARLDSKSRALLGAINAIARNQAQASTAEVPVLISTEGSLDVEQYAARTGAYLLYCPPSYPTPPEEVKLPRFNLGQDASDFNYLGLSSHCLAPELPIAAVARGAKILEYHVQLDDEPSELEASVSLSISQFRDMVQAVRRTEEMLA
jgi:pseudaminic acid synthase